MAKFAFDTQPALRYLSDAEIVRVHKAAMTVLEEVGVFFDNEELISVLAGAGCQADLATKVVKIPSALAEDCIRKVPESFDLYDRSGGYALTVGGPTYHFDPGSAGLNFLESDGATCRPATTADMENTARIVDALPLYRIQSTAMTLSDVPKPVMDCYRVYLVLKNSTKPISTGAFSPEGVFYVQALLASVRGGKKALRERPMATMDICSAPPLKWSSLSCYNLMDCAKLGLPIETISVPMPGAASPATLAGSLVIQVAEAVSGIVSAQLSSPGAKMIMGGAPMTMDMRYFTTSLNAVETSQIGTGFAQVARYYGIPSHTYAGLADPKVVDVQAGLETGVSGLAAALGGVNMISGVGMVDFVNTFSLEKLVIDHEMVAMVDRITRGFAVTDETLALDVIAAVGPGGEYLKERHTMKHIRSEIYAPPSVIDKKNRETWEAEGKKDAFARAREEVSRLLAGHAPAPLAPAAAAKLKDAMSEIAEKAGCCVVL
ncbi:MAG: trimethylamine methyltransferase family protein [Clostridiales Family XIII bacterium]|jgi:trimethylamine--corrinoid protein Co-methyltransferase|nr:trimethylamine methyltransferase family protein [Clostridiales Family XIII bacterium]